MLGLSPWHSLLVVLVVALIARQIPEPRPGKRRAARVLALLASRWTPVVIGVLTGAAPLETRTHPARSTTASSARETRPAWRGGDVITIWDPPLVVRVPQIRTRPAPVSLMVADIPVVHLKVPRGA